MKINIRTFGKIDVSDYNLQALQYIIDRIHENATYIDERISDALGINVIYIDVTFPEKDNVNIRIGVSIYGGTRYEDFSCKLGDDGSVDNILRDTRDYFSLFINIGNSAIHALDSRKDVDSRTTALDDLREVGDRDISVADYDNTNNDPTSIYARQEVIWYDPITTVPNKGDIVTVMMGRVDGECQKWMCGQQVWDGKKWTSTYGVPLDDGYEVITWKRGSIIKDVKAARMAWLRERYCAAY